jgi:integrase
VSTLRVHLLPGLGNRAMDEIKRVDMVALQQLWLRQGYARSTVNKVLMLLRCMYNLAIRWEVPGVTVNPTKDVAMLPVDNHRQRFLTEKEAETLMAAVRSSVNPVLEPIVSMLLLTGARKREVLDARWDDIDWERRLWKIPHTKAGKARYVPLSAAALEFLENRHSRSGRNAFIFPNPKTGQPFVKIFYCWDTARQQAGLPELRIHDLRHSFASFLINGGRSLYEVQQLLGHRNSQMTQRYAHLAHETLLDASDVAGGLFSRIKTTAHAGVD